MSVEWRDCAAPDCREGFVVKARAKGRPRMYCSDRCKNRTMARAKRAREAPKCGACGVGIPRWYVEYFASHDG